MLDNLLGRIHFIIVMIRWTGLAPWEFEFTIPGSLTPTFLDRWGTSTQNIIYSIFELHLTSVTNALAPSIPQVLSRSSSGATSEMFMTAARGCKESAAPLPSSMCQKRMLGSTMRTSTATNHTHTEHADVCTFAASACFAAMLRALAASRWDHLDFFTAR